MDLRITLHTAARHYCEEHYARWMQEYLRSGQPQERGYHIFPRYLVLKAIRIGVERLRPEEASSEEALRRSIVEVGSHAETSSTLHLKEALKNRVAVQAMDEERRCFVEFVQALRGEDLAQVEPLPFRRTLEATEVKVLWDQLQGTWGADYRWYPLTEVPCPDLLAFHTDYFDGYRKGATVLRPLLAQHGVARVFELREFDEPCCEIDLSLFSPAYVGAEGYWTAREADWVVYASHESSITLGGDWLITALKEAWPDWRQRQYGGPFSTVDLRGSWKEE